MKRYFLSGLIILIGCMVMIYPKISQNLYNSQMKSQIQNHEKIISDLEAKSISSEWQKAITYNETLQGDPVHDPFVEGSGQALPDNYESVLDFPDRVMGTVEIPKLSLTLPIYHGTSEAVLQKGLGHMEGTSLPIGGEGSHSVITGHTGLAHSEMFTNLTELVDGDLFIVSILDKKIAYKVDEISVVLPNELEKIKRVDHLDMMTLLTCTPFGVNSHRLLVRGIRTTYNERDIQKVEPIKAISKADKRLYVVMAITGFIVLIVIIIVAMKLRKNC